MSNPWYPDPLLMPGEQAGPVRVWRTTAEVEADRTATLARLNRAGLHPDEADSLARLHGLDPADVRARMPLPPDGTPATGGAWPEPLEDAAYHGVLGEIAQAVAPLTEADPVAVLGTLLVMFGAACGGHRSMYQGSQQRANLSLLLVGETGFRGRKGTALDIGRGVFRLAYPDLDHLWLVGVASGEAISGHLTRKDAGGQVVDPRVLIVEPEFGRVLTIMGREGSTLSPVLRNAWDGVPLGHARARDESLVTSHHVALLGHVTPVELRSKLTDADAANGFANRILFLAVRRSQLIPQYVSGTGEDEVAALRDLDDRLRGIPKPDGTRLDAMRRRLRFAYVEGAEEWTAGNVGRWLTMDELGRVIGRYVGR